MEDAKAELSAHAADLKSGLNSYAEAIISELKSKLSSEFTELVTPLQQLASTECEALKTKLHSEATALVYSIQSLGRSIVSDLEFHQGLAKPSEIAPLTTEEDIKLSGEFLSGYSDGLTGKPSTDGLSFMDMVKQDLETLFEEAPKVLSALEVEAMLLTAVKFVKFAQKHDENAKVNFEALYNSTP